MNKRLLEIIQKIQGDKTIIEFAKHCNIHPIKLQNILLEKKSECLSLEEIKRIWDNYEYQFSLNELLTIFNYPCQTNVVKGDIYWVDFGNGNGSIQGGLRPAVIVSNNKNNKYSTTVNVAPITSSINKKSIPSHVEIENCGLNKTSTILVEQTRTINKQDLKGFVGCCTHDILIKLNKAISIQFETEDKENFSMNDFLKYFLTKYKFKNSIKLGNILLKEYNTLYKTL